MDYEKYLLLQYNDELCLEFKNHASQSIKSKGESMNCYDEKLEMINKCYSVQISDGE